ncbi:MAG TPA: hypothetical protein VGL12_13700 [Roseiarcus sp.]|jgi:hypothetical protein
MTVLLLVALGFLAVLAYGAFALGFRLEALAEARRRQWWRRLVG